MNKIPTKVIITGASGYVGAKVYKYLQNSDLEVVGTYFSTKLFEELVHCDLTKKADVSALFEKFKPDVVLHIAANASNGSCEEDPEGAKELNIEATKYLVHEAKKHASKFIFISSFAAYSPKGIYGETKIAAEKLVESLTDYMILRPSLIAGVSPNTTNDRPFNKFVNDIKNKKLEVEYDSSWEFNVTFLEHLAEICLDIILKNKYKNMIIPVVTNQITSRYLLAKEILTPFHIKVNALDKNAAIKEPEIDWEIYSKLDLPTKSYTMGISEIISELEEK